MAKKDKLTVVGARIGKALGRADKEARRRALKASAISMQDLRVISKQVDALTKQLAKTTRRLKKALTS